MKTFTNVIAGRRGVKNMPVLEKEVKYEIEK